MEFEVKRIKKNYQKFQRGSSIYFFKSKGQNHSQRSDFILTKLTC